MSFEWLVPLVLATAVGSAYAARETRRFLIVSIGAAAVVLLLHGRSYFHYTADDAYISFRYARHLSDGIGPVWNPGEWVEGYSNFLWVLILAGFDRVGVDIEAAARALGFVLALAAVAGAYRLSEDLLEGDAGRWAGLTAALLLSSAGPFALWAFAGLETSLFAAAILAGSMLHLRERGGRTLPYSGLAWGAAALTRPDGPIFFAVSATFKVAEAALRWRDAGDNAARRREIQESAMHIVIWAAAFAAIFVPYWAWRWHAYGYFFPNTFYAKVGGGETTYHRGLFHLMAFAQEHAAWLLLMSVPAALLTRIHREPLAYLVALLAAWFGYIVYIGGDTLVRFRFFAPVLPVVYVVIATSGAALVDQLRAAAGPTAPKRAVEALAGALVLALMAFTLYASSVDPALREERRANSNRNDIGRWLRANVPSDTTVALTAAGIIPFRSGLYTIDMLGINDEHIAHRNVPLGYFGAGHEKYDVEYVLDRQPDIILAADIFSNVPYDRERYRSLESVIIIAISDMLRNPRLFQEYEPRAVEILEGQWFSLLVRKDAAAVLARTQPATGP
jgi:hypothetical protein